MLSYWAIACLVVGVFAVVWPDKITRLGERVNVLDSGKSRSSLQSTDWKVMLLRTIGSALATFGIVWLVLA